MLRRLAIVSAAATPLVLCGFFLTDMHAAGLPQCSDTDGNDPTKGSFVHITYSQSDQMDLMDFCAYRDTTNDPSKEDGTNGNVGGCSGENCVVAERICDANSQYGYLTVLHDCPNGCTDGICFPKKLETCGNEVIDAGEECDSGSRNSDDLENGKVVRTPGFCTLHCQFYWYNEQRVPVVCQTMNNVPVASNMECKVHFGKLSGSCVMKQGSTSCTTSMELPPNNDERHFSRELYGTLNGRKQTITAYNGVSYFVNFGGSLDLVPVSSQKSSRSSSARTKTPPAGFEGETRVNAEVYDNPFPDTRITELSGRAAAELHRRGVIGGFPDGTFRGWDKVNRAQAAKFLLLAKYGEIGEETNDGRFPDVIEGEWYTPFVMAAARFGIIKGHPDGTFRPGDTVNTAEFLKMLTLTFGLEESLPYPYEDVSPSDWFSVYAGVAAKYDLFPERQTALRPGALLTRDDVAIAISQYLWTRE